jgi:hypothetical protein
LHLNYVLKRYLQKEKTVRAISNRDSSLSARNADRLLLNKSRPKVEKPREAINGHLRPTHYPIQNFHLRLHNGAGGIFASGNGQIFMETTPWVANSK